MEVTYIDGQIVAQLPGKGVVIGREMQAGWPLPEGIKGKVFLLEYLSVSQQYINQGYGTRLVEFILDEVKKTGIENVLVYVQPMAHMKNTKANMNQLIRFYAKFGFQVVEKRRQYTIMLLTRRG